MPRRKRTAEPPPFEAQLSRLEEVTELLDRSDLPLADLLQLYEEGVQLAESCREFLLAAEQTVYEIQLAAETNTADTVGNSSDRPDDSADNLDF